MKATFEDMYSDIKMVGERSRRQRREAARTPAGPAVEDRKEHQECKYCGMDREKFGFSRMLIRYDDGTAVPTCSIHCTGIDLALNPHKGVSASLVGDYDTRVLIDAEAAFWVLRGDRMGVMSIRGKWAFGDRKAAERFIKEHGGSIVAYDNAMKAALEDMYEILRRERREANRPTTCFRSASALMRRQASSSTSSPPDTSTPRSGWGTGLVAARW